MTTRDIFDRSADLITPKRVFGDPYTTTARPYSRSVDPRRRRGRRRQA